MIPNTLTNQLSLPKLRLWLIVLFLLLALPIAALVWHAYGQLKWEAFHQHRGMAEELSDRISTDFDRYIRQADSRRFADYSFLVVAGDTSAPFLQRSPLSAVPVTQDVPGAIGYFQIDAKGKFSTPLLPGDDTSLTAVGIGSTDFNNRELLATQLLNILNENQLVDEPLDTTEELAEVPSETLVDELADVLAETLAEEPANELTDELAGAATQEQAQLKVERAQDNDLSAGAVNQPDAAPAPSQSQTQSQTQSRNSLQPIKKIDSQLAFDKLKSVVSSSKTLSSRSALSADNDTDEQQALTNSTTAVPELNLDIRLEERSRAIEKAEQQAMPAIEPEVPLHTEDESNVESASSRIRSSEFANKQDANRSTRTERNYVPELSKEISSPNSASSFAESSNNDAAFTTELERENTALRETNASPILEQLGNTRITTFESDIDPMEISLLGSGHFVAYRTVWREGQRLIQGILIERSVFIDQLIRAPFQQATVSSTSSLSLIYQGSLLDTFRPTTRKGYSSADTDMNGALLYRNKLPAPLDTLELVFSIQRLPPGPGASVLAWVTAVLATVLLGGFYLLYRAARKQIALSAQQQDFVSAVSHELKTPLTSIRMYGELLQKGWAPEEKKQQYYTYIQDESERLTRLIDNVLKLARINRNELSLEMQSLPVADLMASIESNLQQQAESSGFDVQFSVDESVKNDVIIVDKDSIMQIMVNLLDNAIKFSKHAERKSIEVTARSHTDGKLVLSVRDFGPGVPKDQLKNIFRMFYRSENELTRETVGTGIGLAIVNQLCNAMNADVDVRNCDPGVEFMIVVSIS